MKKIILATIALAMFATPLAAENAHSGRPLGLVSDNGTELTSLAMLKWAQDALTRYPMQ